jgi:hypothetical protein
MAKTTTTLLRLGIASILAITAAAITTTTASAEKVPLFSFCHKVGDVAGASFTSEKCSSTEQSTSTGEWALAYADTASSLLLCLLKTGGNYTNLFCNELSSVGGGNSEITLTATVGTPVLVGLPLHPATLKAEVVVEKTEISCTKGTFKDQPKESGKLSEGKLEYTGCTVTKPLKCGVPEPIIGEFTGQLLAGDKVLLRGSRTSGSDKEVFTELEYVKAASDSATEKCAVEKIKFPLFGQQYCEGLSGILTLKVTQTLICRGSESSLKVGANKAELANEISFEASSKEFWAILLVSP